MSVNFYPAAEFIHKALTSGGKTVDERVRGTNVGRFRFNTFILGLLFVGRYGAGPLHSGSEPLSHSGSGLPDDQTEPDPGGGHQNSEGPPWCHPQPRFPPSAQRPGRHPERESKDVTAELRGPSTHRQPEVAAEPGPSVEVPGPSNEQPASNRGSSFTRF